MSRPINHYHLQISVDFHLFDKLYWLVYFMAASFHDTSLVFSVSILAQTCWFFYICYDLLGFRCYQYYFVYFSVLLDDSFLLYEQCSENRQCPRTEVCELTDCKRDRVFSESF